MSGSPANYFLPNTFDPFDEVMQGRAQGIQLRQSAEKRQRTMDMQNKMAQYANQPGGITVEDIEQIQTEYPEISDHYDKTYERLDSEQKQSSINTMLPVYSLMEAGENDKAVEMLEQIKQGNLNVGDEEGATAVDAQIKLVQSDPKAAKLGMTMALSNLMPSGEFRKLTDKQGVVRTETLTDSATGEAVSVGYGADGQVLFRTPVEGLRRSQTLTPEQQAAKTTATTGAKKEAELPFKLEEESRTLTRQKEKELRVVKRTKDYRNLSQGLSSVLDAIDIFEENPGIKSLGGELARKLGRGEAGKFEVAIKDATDILTRIRTGAALNNQEIEFYNTQYTPKWYNDDETANLKLEKLRQIFEESEKRMTDPTHDRVELNEFFNDSVLDLERQVGRRLTSEEISELRKLGEI